MTGALAVLGSAVLAPGNFSFSPTLMDDVFKP